nr:MAG TPA: hypothetical protein [Bacteriophage sp.]
MPSLSTLLLFFVLLRLSYHKNLRLSRTFFLVSCSCGSFLTVYTLSYVCMIVNTFL